MFAFIFETVRLACKRCGPSAHTTFRAGGMAGVPNTHPPTPTEHRHGQLPCPRCSGTPQAPAHRVSPASLPSPSASGEGNQTLRRASKGYINGSGRQPKLEELEHSLGLAELRCPALTEDRQCDL